MNENLTPWFPANTRPVRSGMYRIQDYTLNCGCCWIDARWDGKHWFTDLFTKGSFSKRLIRGQVKRWRGLATTPEETT